VRFHDALTPRQVLRFYADLRGTDADRIGTALQRVDLTAAAERPCGALSGGMRQRLGLALLALSDPKVLLLDEPGLSLDPDWRRVLMQWLRDCADTGATVLMATHLLEIWRPAIDRVLTCADGRIRAGNASSNPVAA
jgi:ABC-type multidrug transport system ATPase subunit